MQESRKGRGRPPVAEAERVISGVCACPCKRPFKTADPKRRWFLPACGTAVRVARFRAARVAPPSINDLRPCVMCWTHHAATAPCSIFEGPIFP